MKNKNMGHGILAQCEIEIFYTTINLIYYSKLRSIMKVILTIFRIKYKYDNKD
jgi:hypothetical protein